MRAVLKEGAGEGVARCVCVWRGGNKVCVCGGGVEGNKVCVCVEGG